MIKKILIFMLIFTISFCVAKADTVSNDTNGNIQNETTEGVRIPDAENKRQRGERRGPQGFMRGETGDNMPENMTPPDFNNGDVKNQQMQGENVLPDADSSQPNPDMFKRQDWGQASEENNSLNEQTQPETSNATDYFTIIFSLVILAIGYAFVILYKKNQY